jgi:hypothetical protein
MIRRCPTNSLGDKVNTLRKGQTHADDRTDTKN